MLADVFPITTVHTQVMTLELFGRNDLTLGYYIEHLCLNPKFNCNDSSCDQPLDKHVRCFVHAEARVLIGYGMSNSGPYRILIMSQTIAFLLLLLLLLALRVEKLAEPIPNPNPGEPHKIFMWSYCSICQQRSPAVPMSPEVGVAVLHLFFCLLSSLMLSC